MSMPKKIHKKSIFFYVSFPQFFGIAFLFVFLSEKLASKKNAKKNDQEIQNRLLLYLFLSRFWAFLSERSPNNKIIEKIFDPVTFLASDLPICPRRSPVFVLAGPLGTWRWRWRTGTGLGLRNLRAPVKLVIP
jgi:hypothetical protein